ncbi:hypothetical protein E3N88_25177 [Mikania micrantha]|uniref:Uncharacterized protein n=1 Tax=Mikania micrantha TaxID=192012 RepID=A0A5N6N410_9ASTR|nr:hypothetical protein E3N88_25177 [Mikania micrantha]
MSPKSRSRFQRRNCEPRKGEVIPAIKKKHSINAQLHTLMFFVHQVIGKKTKAAASSLFNNQRLFGDN